MKHVDELVLLLLSEGRQPVLLLTIFQEPELASDRPGPHPGHTAEPSARRCGVMTWMAHSINRAMRYRLIMARRNPRVWLQTIEGGTLCL
jgi:hypothetical protein